MDRNHARHGLTRVELLLVFGIIGCVIALVLPLILQVRESVRKSACGTNLRQLGVAMAVYAENSRRFAPSSTVTRDRDGKITAVDGWSWQVCVLPYMDTSAAIGNGARDVRVNSRGARPLREVWLGKQTPNADLLATRFPWLLCPSFRGSPYADPATKRQAITNYKAMGATHMESLSIASPKPLTPKYGPKRDDVREYSRQKPRHPDGVLYPGFAVIEKGITASHSFCIVAVESLEPRFARWTVGAEATVVGLPRNVEFETYTKPAAHVPKGYALAVAEDPQAEASYWTYRPYIDWDYRRAAYDGAGGTQGGMFGPSGNHGSVVNHLFLSGSVQAMPRWIDVTAYMCMILRENPWNESDRIGL